MKTTHQRGTSDSRKRLTSSFTSLALGLMAMLITLPVHAFFIDVSASQDSLINEDEASTVYGNSWYVQVGGYTLNHASDILLQFDLSAYSGRTVNSATINLYRVYKYYSGSPDVTAHRITESWDEATTTYNNRPAYDGSVVTTTSLPATGTNIWCQWDITSLVQDWVNGTANNHGVFLATDDNYYTMSRFYSRNSSAAETPYLRMDVEAVPEPSVTAMLTVSLAALGIRRLFSRCRRKET